MVVPTWNVAGRQRRLGTQVARVLSRTPDVVALQEITAATYQPWCERLASEGYTVLSSIDLLGIPYPPPVIRKNFNIIAARHPINALPGLSFPDPEQARVAFPEKYLAARIVWEGVAVDFHNAHLPPGSTREIIKPHAFEAIRRRFDEATDCPQVLCGDFNTPAAEDDEGITTWGWKHPALREMWDKAEMGILRHPRLRDVYRELREAGEPFAWSHRTNSGPKRYDHIYVSDGLTAHSCKYWTEWVDDEKLSDHAALEAELTLASGRRQASGPADTRTGLRVRHNRTGGRLRTR
jgi:endonuclease/exonuclease/phosphatase family metal-dependent hydrolase